MKIREAVYLLAVVIMWSVAWPCWTYIQVQSEKNETKRVAIRQRDDLTSALNRSTEMLNAALGR